MIITSYFVKKKLLSLKFDKYNIIYTSIIISITKKYDWQIYIINK